MNGVPYERGEKRGEPPHPLKGVILALLARLTWKRLQIDTNLPLII